MSPTTRLLLADAPPLTDLRLLPNLELWLSTKDPADILAPGNAVQLWRDKSGKSNETVLACDGTAGGTFTNGGTIGTGDYTLAFYVRTSDSSTVQMLFDMGAAATSGCTIGGGGFAPFGNAYPIGPTITTNVLTHMAAVRSGTTLTLYIDGASAGTHADTYNISAITTIAKSASNTLKLSGYLQRPAIWGRALSAGEVATLYAAGGAATAVSSANLLAYWDFSTATRGAATVTDTSGNSCVLTTSTGARISGARDLYQGTAASQPAYDSAAQTITTDGVNDYMKTAPFALVQPEWVVMVGRQVSWTSNDYIFDGNTGDTMSLRQTSGGISPNIEMRANGTPLGITGPAIGSTFIATMVFNASSSLIAINRGVPNLPGASVGSADAGGFTLGCYGNGAAVFANIAFNELAIFSRAPSAADIVRVVNYMARKWGL